MSATPARRAAYVAVRRAFEDGAWVDRAFRSIAVRAQLDPRELAQAQRLAYGAVQRRATADDVIERLAGRPAGDLDPPIRAALRLGLYEVLFASATPDHAAVDQAVELAKSAAGGPPPARRAAAGLVNAVLRRAARERAALLARLDDSTADGAATALSYPLWLARMWWSELGAADARSLMRALNEPAETALRANTLRTDAAQAAAALREAGVDASRASAANGGLLAPPEAIVVHGAGGQEVARRLAAGELVAQARSSQAVVAALDPRPGERVLELCAGPGTKTTQLAARMRNRGEVVAVERDPARAQQVEEQCARTGADIVRVVVADATACDLGGGYDRVLVDPPCSDLGALASRPDARWRKSPDQIDRLTRLQRALLERGAGALGPRGTLLYSTCTISRRENEAVVAAALAGMPGLAADPLGTEHPPLASRHDPRHLQIRPDRDGTDGFFVARLRRRAEG